MATNLSIDDELELLSADLDALLSPPTQLQRTASSLKLRIGGMTCGSCVASVTKTLLNQKGVKDASVNLERMEALLSVNIKSYDLISIIEAVEDSGFECHFISDSTATDSAVQQSAQAENNPNSLVHRSSTPPPLSMPKKLMRDDKVNASDISLVKGSLFIASIGGMSCTACVNAIEKHMNAQPGIMACSVSLTMERADIEYNPDLFKNADEEICEMIEEIGFDAKPAADAETEEDVVELQILGMTCASCSGSIERAIAEMDGVLSCSFSVLNQSGRFEILKKKVGVRDIVEKIEDIGFQAFLHDKTSAGNAQVESLARSKEIKKWRDTFWKSFQLAIPILLISMFLPRFIPDILNATFLIPGLSVGHFLVWVLCTPVQYGVGMTFHKKAWKALKHSSYTMDVLLSLGSNLAYIFSVISILVSISRGGKPSPQIFFETSSTLITFVSLGRYLENSAKSKTSSALSSLISLAPAHALLFEKDGSTREIPAAYIKAGDLLKILPGERMPCDGTVEFGKSEVDESLVTGEPLPLLKVTGDTVISGTVNGSSVLHVRAERVGSDTTLSQIVKLVSGAQASKAPIQAAADRVSAVFVPVIIALGCLTFSVWMVIIESTGWIPSSFPSDSNHVFVCLSMCISVIVVACPCALGLATPTAVMVGTGVGAKHGILIKGGEPLETAQRITKIVFDKTGTLTLGQMSVIAFEIFPGASPVSRKELVDLVVCVEGNSEHPIGKSIAAYCRSSAHKTLECESVPGSGMFAIHTPSHYWKP